MIFFGANDGMIHAVDARTGYEVWAFIPYNLLPKLRTLADGQPVEQFDYFVDSSPKIAEVKIERRLAQHAAHRPGAGRHVLPGLRRDRSRHGRRSRRSTTSSAVSALLAQFDTPNESIRSSGRSRTTRSFDPTYTATFTVTDGTPGGKVQALRRPEGDARRSRRRRSGFTWSDPAVGPLEPRSLDQRGHRRLRLLPGHRDARSQPRRDARRRPATSLYLIDADTGELLGNLGRLVPDDLRAARDRDRLRVIGDVDANGREERAAGRPDGGRRLRQLTSSRRRTSATSTASTGGSTSPTTGSIIGAADGRHRPADLRIVGAAVHRQRRHLHVLRDGQRPAAQQRAGRYRHVPAVRA